MRISRKAEYALRALILMCRQPMTRVHQLQELSREGNIPMKFLEQILLSLRNGSILGSKRGVGGGYTLLKMPRDISIGGVISLLDGPIGPLPCAHPESGIPCTCPDPASCELRIFMTGIREVLEGALAQKTLEDLLALSPKHLELAFDI